MKPACMTQAKEPEGKGRQQASLLPFIPITELRKVLTNTHDLIMPQLFGVNSTNNDKEKIW